MEKSGLFISFEGTEGSGKSTLAQHLSLHLEKLGYRTLQTREPGGSAVGEKIRSILLHSDMDPWTELLLYQAARAEHLATTLQPALQRGEIVLCDRFTDSTLAYQAFARKLPWAKVNSLNQIATRGLQPDLTLFLDIDPRTGLDRVKDPNRFEAEGLAFQKKVRSGYLKARAQNPQRWLTLKIKSQSPEELAEKVKTYLLKRFKNRLQGSNGR